MVGLMIEDILVEYRNKNLQRMGAIHRDQLNAKVHPVFNGVGTFSLSLPAEDIASIELKKPGAGVIVTNLRNGKVLLSGTVFQPNTVASGSSVLQTMTFTGYSDDRFLWDARAFPNPEESDVEKQTRAYDRRKGDAETLIREFAAFNICNGAITGESLAPLGRLGGFRNFLTLEPVNKHLGDVITKSARFDRLGDLLYEIAAEGGGLGFRVAQMGDRLEIQTYQPTNRSDTIRLDIRNGTIASQATASTAPTVTRVITAGQGEGADRTFVDVRSSLSQIAEDQYGFIIEDFKDQRNTNDRDELVNSGLSILSEGSATVSVKANPSSDQSMIFMEDYYLGDRIAVTVDGKEYENLITESAIVADSSGVNSAIAIGDVYKFTERASVAKSLRDIDSRVESIERNTGISGSAANANYTLSAGIHGSHSHPQHRFSDDVTWIGAIEGNVTQDDQGNSPVVVDVINHKTGRMQRLVVGWVPTDDHSPAIILTADGSNAAWAVWTPHQVVRRLYFTKMLMGDDGVVTVGDTIDVPAPKPTDTDGTTTYAQGLLRNEDTHLEDGYQDWLMGVRVGWWWMDAVVRTDTSSDDMADWSLSFAVPFRGMLSFRNLPFVEGGGADQGYMNWYRQRGDMVDMVVYSHPTNADDRNVYFTTFNIKTGDVDNGLANIYSGVGLPLRRNMLEVAYARPEYTNVRTLGGGGLLKHQLLLVKWNTSGGTTAASPSNARYLLYTRGAVPADKGLQLLTTGSWAQSANRAAYQTADIDFDIDYTPTSFTPTAQNDICSKWNTTNNQRSWRLFSLTAGGVSLSFSLNGVDVITATSTAVVPTTSRALRVQRNAATGEVTFRFSTDGVNFSILGNVVPSTPGNVFAGTAALAVGRANFGNPGTYRRFKMRSSIGGPLVVDIDFTRGWANGDAAGVVRGDYFGQTWGLQSQTLIKAAQWTQDIDLGPVGEPIGYTEDIQYVSDGMCVPGRDDQVILARLLPGPLSQVALVQRKFDGGLTETLLAESQNRKFFRPRAAVGEGGPLYGSVAELSQYGPVYTDFASKIRLLWRAGSASR
jgi:hypothetical protein